jgi:hypothetical protein
MNQGKELSLDQHELDIGGPTPVGYPLFGAEHPAGDERRLGSRDSA